MSGQHSCGCSAAFRTEFEGHIHEVGICPLAVFCAASPPCGSCDDCQLVQATYKPYLSPEPGGAA